MIMKTVILLLCTVVALAHAEVGKDCADISQCEEGECCQILSEFMVVSKKRANSGTCQKYTLAGNGCGTFDKLNGYCSCAPGLRCIGKEIPVKPNPTTIAKKTIIAPRPGYYWSFTCSKPEDRRQLQPSY